MIPYSEMPGSAMPRPFLDVLLGSAELRVRALVDSGAVHTLFHEDWAAEAGIDLSDAEVRSLAHGVVMQPCDGRFVTVQMEAGGHSWEAEVGFVNRLPDWGLLGQQSFFRYFTVEFRAADLEFGIAPIEG